MVLTVPFLSYLNGQANKDSLTKHNQLKMPRAYLFMGYLMILISLTILIIPRLMKNAPKYYHISVWIVIAALFLFGLYILRLCSLHKISIEDNNFTIHSVFGQNKTFSFDDIQSMDMSRFTYFITITNEAGEKGKFYFHLKGLINLLREIRSKSGRDITDIERLLKI